MTKVRATPHAVYNINYHIVWIPKYRKHILTHGVKERLTEILHEIAERYDFDIKYCQDQRQLGLFDQTSE